MMTAPLSLSKISSSRFSVIRRVMKRNELCVLNFVFDWAIRTKTTTVDSMIALWNEMSSLSARMQLSQTMSFDSACQSVFIKFACWQEFHRNLPS